MGHRGRSGDPLYGIRATLRCGYGMLRDKQKHRLEAVFANDAHAVVEVTWSIYQNIITAYRNKDRGLGKQQLTRIIDSLKSGVPAALPELATLGRTLNRRRVDVLAYFDHPGTSNGPTEAIIIWSPIGGVVDVADGSRELRGRHVLWSLSPTSLTGPGSGCRPWNDSKYCRVYDDVGIPL